MNSNKGPFNVVRVYPGGWTRLVRANLVMNREQWRRLRNRLNYGTEHPGRVQAVPMNNAATQLSLF